MGGRVDHDLLPRGAAFGILEIVELVEDHDAQAGEDARLGGRTGPVVQHRPEHLGRHHQHRRAWVDSPVAGDEAHLVGPEPAGEVAVLLVAECLQRRRVDGGDAGREGTRDRVVGDEGLARARGRHDEYRPLLVEGVHRLELESVGRDTERIEERSAGRVRQPGLRRSGTPRLRGAQLSQVYPVSGGQVSDTLGRTTQVGAAWAWSFSAAATRCPLSLLARTVVW